MYVQWKICIEQNSKESTTETPTIQLPPTLEIKAVTSCSTHRIVQQEKELWKVV